MAAGVTGDALHLAIGVQPEKAVSGGLGGKGVVGESQGEGAGVHGVEASDEGLDEASEGPSGSCTSLRTLCTLVDANQTICHISPTAS